MTLKKILKKSRKTNRQLDMENKKGRIRYRLRKQEELDSNKELKEWNGTPKI